MRLRLPLTLALASLTLLSPLPGPAAPATDDASAHTLSLGRARTVSYNLARRVGIQNGAVYAIAGYCKRSTRHRVVCWAGIVWSDYTGAAQRVEVILRGRRTRARRFGRVYSGYLGERRSSQSGGEWAICGIRQSVCIGS